jgi:hypothetical protein
MVIRWTAELGEEGWSGGSWGRCEDAALMSRDTAIHLAEAMPGAKVVREDQVFDCDGFEDDDE